jgi:uncharacterized coiled-coil protein SlyX
VESQRAGRHSRLAERVGRLMHGRSGPTALESTSPDVGWEHRLESVEARVEHLEIALEGLQDALYRHEVLDEENISELRRRMDPEQIARDLSQDARRRGL